MYTNEYDDNNQEAYVEENVKVETSGGSNKIKLIIIGVLVIVLIALVVLVLKNNAKKSNNYTIAIYPERIIVPLGKSQNVSYEIRNNTKIVENANVKLNIEDETVAKLENTNIVGLKYGKTMLKVIFTDSDGKTMQEVKEVTVADGDPTVAITNVSFPTGDLRMPLEGTYDIEVVIEPEKGFVENKKFTSFNNEIVTVNEYGTVTAVSEGQTTIRIEVNNGLYKKDLKVSVNKNNSTPSIVNNPTKVTINNAITKLLEGESATLLYTVSPENADTSSISWTSSNPTVLTVDNTGKITAIKEGTATISVNASNNVSDHVIIKVEKNALLVTDITLSVSTINLNIGQSETLVPQVVPDEATDKTLTYTSSNPEIASVIVNEDNSATVEGIATGSAVITVKSSNGIEKNISVTVVEGEIPVDPGTEPSSGTTSGGSGCKAGKYLSNGKCVECPKGYYCSGNKKNSCGTGKTTNGTGKSKKEDCVAITCTIGTYLTSDGRCVTCPVGSYCQNNNKYSCGSGKTTTGTGKKYKSDCYTSTTIRCSAGTYFDSSLCQTCPVGYYCPGGTGSSATRISCGPSKTTDGSGKSASSDCKRFCTIAHCSSYASGRSIASSTCKCTVCVTGYKLSGNSCVEITSSSGGKCCSACGGDTTCLSSCNNSC